MANESNWVTFDPRELQSGLYWVFGYQEEVDGDVDDYGRNRAWFTGRSEVVKSIAYIKIMEDGEFYLKTIPSLFHSSIMGFDYIDGNGFIPSFVIPITPPIDPEGK